MKKKIISKYYGGKCPKEEWQAIAKDAPAFGGDFLSEEEWNTTEPENNLLPGKLPEKFLEGLLHERSSSNRVNPILKWAVAAVILLAAGFGTYYWQMQEAGESVPKMASAQNDIVVPQYIHKVNTGKTVEKILLPDRSMVELSPGSHIRYATNYNSKVRDIYLSGTAVFHVYKDALHPFTVYCKGVATTALGTVFRVSDLSERNRVSVRLLEGKILVRRIVDNKITSRKYYLLPGNGIDYDLQKKVFVFDDDDLQDRRQVNTDIVSTKGKPEDRIPSSGIAIHMEQNAIKFDDVSLEEVLNTLADKRGVKISYPTNKVSNIKFIGTVNDKTPVSKVLSDIASMNNLSLTIDSADGRFIIK